MNDFIDNINATVARIRELTTQADFQHDGYTYQGAKYLTMQFGSHKSRPLPADIGKRESFGFNQQVQYLVKIQMNSLDLSPDMPKEGITLSDDEGIFGKEHGWKLVGAKVKTSRLDLWLEG